MPGEPVTPFLTCYLLKPKIGGVLLLCEGNLDLHNAYKVSQEPAYGEGGPGQSWLARMCLGTLAEAIFPPAVTIAEFSRCRSVEARTCNIKLGSCMDAVEMLEPWVREEPELCDVKYETKWIPIGPWEHGAPT